MTQHSTQSIPITAADRLGFTIFTAIAVHALIVLGIAFTYQDKVAPPPTLEITLASYESKERPKEADYLAQINQQGSGLLDEKALPSSDQQAKFQDDMIREVDPQLQQQLSMPQQTVADYQYVVTTETSDDKMLVMEDKEPQPEASENIDTSQEQMERITEIASLEAQFYKQLQEYANRPRIKRLNSASTVEEPGAYYKESWRRRVELIGNINYPTQARQQKLYGELRMAVTIRKNGSLVKVEILEPSGSAILDEAALKIVRMAAPYEPFDDSLKNFDMVEIIRTWRFERGGGQLNL